MALRICLVIVFLALVATGVGWLITKWNLEATSEQYAYSLEEVSRLAGIANGQLMLTNQQVESANNSIGQLEEELAGAEKFGAYWWGKAHPREFESVDELKAWLAQDDTDSTLYIFGSGCVSTYDCDDYATALVYNALCDGYLVSTQIDDNHMLNSTIIGNNIYYIEPQNDNVWLWGHRD
jgi:hypothetical protein